MVPEIRKLLVFFSRSVSDHTTLNELLAIIDDESRWTEAHILFSRIRDKTLRAEQESDSKLVAQYCFEEICAQSIYNESEGDMPFDSDSPFWVLPLAIDAARKLGISDHEVLENVLY